MVALDAEPVMAALPAFLRTVQSRQIEDDVEDPKRVAPTDGALAPSCGKLLSADAPTNGGHSTPSSIQLHFTILGLSFPPAPAIRFLAMTTTPIFVSHAASDAALATALFDLLQNGCNVQTGTSTARPLRDQGSTRGSSLSSTSRRASSALASSSC